MRHQNSEKRVWTKNGTRKVGPRLQARVIPRFQREIAHQTKTVAHRPQLVAHGSFYIKTGFMLNECKKRNKTKVVKLKIGAATHNEPSLLKLKNNDDFAERISNSLKMKTQKVEGKRSGLGTLTEQSL